MKLVPAVRARPKSRIFNVQSDLTTILLGFKSFNTHSVRLVKLAYKFENARRTYSVNDSSKVQVFYPAQHLIEEVGHTFVIKIHLDHLSRD